MSHATSISWSGSRKHRTRDASIFHFGTGSHHIVGLKTAEDGSNNAVFGITASPAEYDAYIKMLIEKPRLGFTYKAYFGDIYQLDRRLLPDVRHRHVSTTSVNSAPRRTTSTARSQTSR